MLTAFYRVAGFAKSALLTISRSSATDQYVTTAPSPQHALDIFKGEWASKMPAPLDRCDAGALPLFGDPRLQWGVDRLGGVAGQRVIELDGVLRRRAHRPPAEAGGAVQRIEAGEP